MNNHQQSFSENPQQRTSQHVLRPTPNALPVATEAHPPPSPPSTSRDAHLMGIPVPRPRIQPFRVEGLGWDHSRSSACGILGIGSRTEGDTVHYDPSKDIADRDIKSEKIRWYIQRKIEKWEKKYPGGVWWTHYRPSYAPPSGTPGPARLPRTTGLRPLPRIGIDHIDARIAAVTAPPQVPSNWGPARGASVPSSNDAVIPLDNERTTVSGRPTNPFGAIGPPLP